MESYEKIKKVLALGFMNFLDENKPKDKMCLSNGECADIEKAFNEQDWPRLAGYLDKYTESEDERIRKAIIELLKEVEEDETYTGRQHIPDMLSYLEKQKGDKDELVYRLNGLMQDYIKEGKDDEEKEHRLKCYQLFWDALEDANFFEQIEQKPQVVCEAKAYDLGYKQGKEDAIKEQKPAVSREEILHQLLQNGSITLSDYLYLTEEHKPAEWSEEDESELTAVIYCVSRAIKASKDENERNSLLSAKKWLQDKLSFRVKSLHPSWKPSEEQMDALERASTNKYLSAKQFDILVSLYEQLKKL